MHRKTAWVSGLLPRPVRRLTLAVKRPVNLVFWTLLRDLGMSRTYADSPALPPFQNTDGKHGRVEKTRGIENKGEQIDLLGRREMELGVVFDGGFESGQRRGCQRGGGDALSGSHLWCTHCIPLNSIG